MRQPSRYDKILIANRGEIAVRVIRACRVLGISPVAVYSEADAGALHVQLADEAYCLGPPPASESYLSIPCLLEAARSAGVEAIHPGYGFLSENAAFAEQCRKAGFDFIGPPAETIAWMGSKTAAKATMQQAGVPVIPGYHGAAQDDATFLAEATALGFPVLVKASAGGGGKGMRVVKQAAALTEALAAARREAKAAFGDNTLLLEKYFSAVRHIEFQILADHQGQVLHLYERECSIQRRHQKVLEETPSLALTPQLRDQMAQAAVQAARAVNYRNAGTIEMMLDDQGQYYFLEMNTRLQVEHPVTEMTLGVDLVAEQIRIAAGEPLSFSQADLSPRGHAIEARIYAENPQHNFLPTTGQVVLLQEPQGPGIRLDSALYPTQEVTPYYDPLLAKLIAWGRDREEARLRLCRALEDFVILGVTTNIPYLLQILSHPGFIGGQLDTHFLDQLPPQADPAEVPGPVLAAAALTVAKKAARSSLTAVYNPWLQLGSWEI